MKCVPWTATSKTIKAYETQVFDTFTAFKITLSFYFENEGEVEFRYRKDTKRGQMNNGEFKFIVNNEKVFIDADYMENDW